MKKKIEDICNRLNREQLSVFGATNELLSLFSVMPCFSWTLFDNEEPHPGYIAITDGNIIEFCECYLGIDVELNYTFKQLTEMYAWFDATEIKSSLNKA